MKDIVEKIIQPFEDFISEETELLPFAETGFTPIQIDKENFHELGIFSNSKDIIAVDGGNAEILSGAGFSVQFIRVVALTSPITLKEFFCFIRPKNIEGKINYLVKIFGDNLFDKDIIIPSKFKTIDGQNFNLDISSVGDIIRRYSELILAEQSLQQDTYLIMDGSIKAKTETELSYLKKLINKSKTNNTVIGFLSKTCSLLTKNGYSLSTKLQELGPKSSWYYHPVFDIQDNNYLGEMLFVRLSQKSYHVFRLELSSKKDDFILALSKNSKDPVFHGYPYCLIQADKLARVSNKENDYLRTMFLAKIKNKSSLKYLLSTKDAHLILDNIS